MEGRVTDILERALQSTGRIVVLTGAGISAESGIPTFRGREGYWTIGSKEYHPQEMATHQMFQRAPDDVWQWYLYRRGVCRNAVPNAAHQALVQLERAFPQRFLLITQNVDGLHRRAGSSAEHTYEIHGNIDRMRCSAACTREVYDIPLDLTLAGKKESMSSSMRDRLVCPRCGDLTRPHILWFDECYDEDWYRFESSTSAATDATLLIVVGTSGATNLPMMVGSIVARRGAAMIDINPTSNPFSQLAQASPHGTYIQGRAAVTLPSIVEHLSRAETR